MKRETETRAPVRLADDLPGVQQHAYHFGDDRLAHSGANANAGANAHCDRRIRRDVAVDRGGGRVHLDCMDDYPDH